MFKIFFDFLNNCMLFKILLYQLYHLHNNPVVSNVIVLGVIMYIWVFEFPGGIINNIDKKWF